jgi:Tol biopolymer transport system component
MLPRTVPLLLVICLTILFQVVSAGEPVQITTCGGDNPTVSPDGAWIAFELSRERGIAKVSAQGGGPQVLFSRGHRPDWSSANGLIAFDTGDSLYVLDPWSGEATLLCTGLVNPAWSPDGWQIAGTMEGSLGLRSLGLVDYPEGTPEPISMPQMSCEYYSPAWHSAGDSLYFVCEERLYSVSRGGGDAVGHCGPHGEICCPAESQDGHWLAYSELLGLPFSQIMVASLDEAGDVMAVTDATTGDSSSPAWAPGSQLVYFGAAGEIWRVELDDTPVERCTWGSVKWRWR